MSAAVNSPAESHVRCLDLLLTDVKQTTDPATAQNLRKTSIAITPHILHDSLRAYLDDLAWSILDVGAETTERAVLVEAAFRMVLEGLSDENRRIGMDWWLRWKPRFVETGGLHGVSAKL
jgi:hypothetical protein